MNDEEIPVRSPVRMSTPDNSTDNDDEDFSTIVNVKKILDKSIEGLYKDFNAFSLVKDSKLSTDEQIAARQIAYDILVPVQSMIDSATQSVIERRKV